MRAFLAAMLAIALIAVAADHLLNRPELRDAVTGGGPGAAVRLDE